MKRGQNAKYYLAAAIALITFIIYVPALQNDFINWDDDLYVSDNIHIRSIDPTFFKWAFFDFYAAYWQPLTWISHALDYAIWGLKPAGHHLTNNILHAINAFMVVLLVMRLLELWKKTAVKTGQSKFPTEGGILTVGGIAGLLFGLHPLHVESAAWVAERKDLLCALFFLLSIMRYATYVSSINNEEAQRNRNTLFRSFNKHYLFTLGFFILALFSKPMAVSLPAVLLILDWYPFNRIQSFKTFWSVLAEKIPLIALSLFSSILIILSHRAAGAMAAIDLIPISTRALVAAKSLIAYIGKMIWPLNLVPFYPYPTNVSLFSFDYLLAVSLVIGITYFCIVIAKKQKLWLSVWGYYVISLIPVLGIVQVGGQSMADRFTYLPSLGPFLIVGLLAAWASDKMSSGKRAGPMIKASGVIVAVVGFFVLSFLTVKQIGIWKDGIKLWSYIIEKEPLRSSVMYTNRGVLYEKVGLVDKAVEDYKQAIALNPGDDQAFFNLGNIYYNAGLLDKAADSYSESIAVNPKRANAYHNRGVVYSLNGQFERALNDFNKAVELDQNLDVAYFNRGELFLKTGRKDLAIADYQKACNLGYKNGCNALRQLP